MAEYLETVPSAIYQFLTNPVTNVIVGCIGSYVSCLSLWWYYYPNEIAPVLASSGLSEKLSTTQYLTTCIVTITICGLLLLDLSLDVWSSLDDYRSKQNYRKKQAALNMKPDSTNVVAEIEKSTEIEDYDFREFFTRLMYIIACLVASISVWAGRPDYRCILGNSMLFFPTLYPTPILDLILIRILKIISCIF